jgi:hypothetical protein
MKKLICKIFARYEVFDNYGTCQYCFTLEAALDWLGYCGTIAIVSDRKTYQILAGRIYSESR